MRDIHNAMGRRRLGAFVGVSATLAALPVSAWAEKVGFPVQGANAASIPGIIDVHGHLPHLAFKMKRVSDNKVVSASAYRGDVVIVYFGFTRCTDTCPLTTLNAARLFGMLGADRSRTRFLFVTVDLEYDTPKRLKNYLAKFGPPPFIDGLYGTPTELNAFAKRYGVYFKAPTGAGSPDPVSAIQHSGAVYLFGPHGEALAIINNLGDAHPHLHALAHKIREIL
ncbi:SCO family protein [Acidiphilium sp.]|uniref:SCO family protein n=1 Tax=Acidiphilium sp. TaxID=527 RepID=UPI003CFC40BF